MFLVQMVATLLARTRPDSSMQKPAAIHITRAPLNRNEKVLKMNAVSAAPANSASWAHAMPAKPMAPTMVTPPAIANRLVVLIIHLSPVSLTVFPSRTARRKSPQASMPTPSARRLTFADARPRIEGRDSSTVPKYKNAHFSANQELISESESRSELFFAYNLAQFAIRMYL